MRKRQLSWRWTRLKVCEPSVSAYAIEYSRLGIYIPNRGVVAGLPELGGQQIRNMGREELLHELELRVAHPTLFAMKAKWTTERLAMSLLDVETTRLFVLYQNGEEVMNGTVKPPISTEKGKR